MYEEEVLSDTRAIWFSPNGDRNLNNINIYQLLGILKDKSTIDVHRYPLMKNKITPSVDKHYGQKVMDSASLKQTN